MKDIRIAKKYDMHFPLYQTLKEHQCSDMHFFIMFAEFAKYDFPFKGLCVDFIICQLFPRGISTCCAVSRRALWENS
jgi:hypothetical protein